MAAAYLRVARAEEGVTAIGARLTGPSGDTGPSSPSVTTSSDRSGRIASVMTGVIDRGGSSDITATRAEMPVFSAVMPQQWHPTAAARSTRVGCDWKRCWAISSARSGPSTSDSDISWHLCHNISGDGHPPGRLTCRRRSGGNRSTNVSGSVSSLIPRSRRI